MPVVEADFDQCHEYPCTQVATDSKVPRRRQIALTLQVDSRDGNDGTDDVHEGTDRGLVHVRHGSWNDTGNVSQVLEALPCFSQSTTQADLPLSFVLYIHVGTDLRTLRIQKTETVGTCESLGPMLRM